MQQHSSVKRPRDYSHIKCTFDDEEDRAQHEVRLFVEQNLTAHMVELVRNASSPEMAMRMFHASSRHNVIRLDVLVALLQRPESTGRIEVMEMLDAICFGGGGIKLGVERLAHVLMLLPAYERTWLQLLDMSTHMRGYVQPKAPALSDEPRFLEEVLSTWSVVEKFVRAHQAVEKHLYLFIRALGMHAQKNSPLGKVASTLLAELVVNNPTVLPNNFLDNVYWDITSPEIMHSMFKLATQNIRCSGVDFTGTQQLFMALARGSSHQEELVRYLEEMGMLDLDVSIIRSMFDKNTALLHGALDRKTLHWLDVIHAYPGQFYTAVLLHNPFEYLSFLQKNRTEHATHIPITVDVINGLLDTPLLTTRVLAFATLFWFNHEGISGVRAVCDNDAVDVTHRATILFILWQFHRMSMGVTDVPQYLASYGNAVRWLHSVIVVDDPPADKPCCCICLEPVHTAAAKHCGYFHDTCLYQVMQKRTEVLLERLLNKEDEDFWDEDDVLAWSMGVPCPLCRKDLLEQQQQP